MGCIASKSSHKKKIISSYESERKVFESRYDSQLKNIHFLITSIIGYINIKDGYNKESDEEFASRMLKCRAGGTDYGFGISEESLKDGAVQACIAEKNRSMFKELEASLHKMTYVI